MVIVKKDDDEDDRHWEKNMKEGGDCEVRV